LNNCPLRRTFSIKNQKMEPLPYQPESEPITHQVTAELVLDEGSGLTFRVRSDGEEIGEVDVELISDKLAFVSGVGVGEKINNGYLVMASLAVRTCLREDYFSNRLELIDIDDQLIN
jgi:hypothetical protein